MHIKCIVDIVNIFLSIPNTLIKHILVGCPLIIRVAGWAYIVATWPNCHISFIRGLRRKTTSS